MKKKLLISLLSVSITVSMISGCGSAAQPEEPVVEAAEEVEDAAEDPVEEEAEEVVYETVSYEVMIASADEEAGTYTAYDAEHEYLLIPSETLSEEEKELFEIGAAVKVSTEVELKEDASGEEEEEVTEVAVTAVEALPEEKAAELANQTFEKMNGFTVEELAPTNMYAKQSVNLRKGPSTDYEQVGKLSFAEEVSVTGIASTGWYQVSYNGEYVYCSNNYLGTTKPEASKKSASASQSASAGTSSQASNSVAASGRDFEAEYKAAMAAGDWDRADEIMNELLQLDGGGVTVKNGRATVDSDVSGGSNSSTKSTTTSVDFVNYLNGQRADEGLGELAWSDSLAATACERAEELVENYSHAGFRNASAEIIQVSGNEDAASLYNGFYGSSAHRDIMLNGSFSKVAAAICEWNSYYYTVVLFE